mmetsp:Transcript_27573/g.89801  ORF Transcript_27573/g.89801 Transcript_27573/m.89801 type:complete len:173 (+) Transcript_27573:320-838(+)
MDGMKTSKDHPVILLGASSRPHVIDSALLRPGRLEHHILVPPPNAQSRHQYLRARMGRRSEDGEDRRQTDKDLTSFGFGEIQAEEEVRSEEFLWSLASAMDGFSFADLQLFCQESALIAIREAMGKGKQVSDLRVSTEHVHRALLHARPSLRGAEIQHPMKLWQTQDEGAER